MKKFFLLLFVMMQFVAFAQKKKAKGEFYFSWGYNKEWYTRCDLKVKQAELGNDYILENVQAHDRPGWDEGLFNIALTIPQYNYRIGYLFNDKHNLGVEINFDHTKYIVANQQVRIKGTKDFKPIDSTITFNEQNGFEYFLNNGANFLLFNIVKRWNYYESKNHKFKLDALGKFGIGPVIPHVQNTFFGKDNDQGFQLGGWNTGIEYALRATFYKTIYLEFASKLDYARYSNLKVYKGTAKHNFGTYEMILSLGVTF
jgi:hypothetical protein